MDRHELSDEQWTGLAALLPTNAGRRSLRGDRNFINAVVWIAKTGSPWRDLLVRFGPWKSVYNRFNRWARRGVWQAIFRTLGISDDKVGVLLDGTIVRAHQDAAGGNGGPAVNGIGRSRGGFSSKLHAIVDTKGRPLDIELTPGQQHDSTMAETLLAFAQGRACIADMGYDADRIVAAIRALGMKAVIPPNPTRKVQRRYDKKLYRLRYRVECFFHAIKRFRRVATRYEKTGRNYLAFVHLAAVLVALT